MTNHSTTHGLRKHPLYGVWNGMMQRCNNPRAPHYESYGHRGIRVCERWYDIGNFISDMGDRPDGYQLERIDNDGDYEPSNCKWASYKEQSMNKRTTKRYNGKTYVQWSEELGVSSRNFTVYALKHSPEEAIFFYTHGRKEYCTKGHRLTDDNVYVYESGWMCKLCSRLLDKNQYQRKKLKALKAKDFDNE